MIKEYFLYLKNLSFYFIIFSYIKVFYCWRIVECYRIEGSDKYGYVLDIKGVMDFCLERNVFL